MGWPWAIHLCAFTRCLVDTQPSPVRPSYPRTTEGNIRCCCFRSTLRYSSDFPPPAAPFVLRGLFHLTVSTMLRVLSSLADVWSCSVLGLVAFYITVCYHTTYASPWIYPPLAFYGFDMLMRMFRFTIKDATLVPVDNQMTLVSYERHFVSRF